ncbi:hypothetical protein [Streptomyces sp. NPDC097640]|uniref:hypothetical protein n=1 Tax=Streptomyces sp. NPDC097640 TaxID=3157229 RepID=UPI003329E0CF
MAFRRITCILAVCDIPGCGNTWPTEDSGEIHHHTEAEALDWVLSDQAELPHVWHQRPDGQLVCWRRDPLHDWAREQDGEAGPGRDAMTVSYEDQAVSQ